MSAEALDELSTLFRAAVVGRFPEWRSRLRVVGEDAGSRAVELNIPQEHGERRLRLSTAGGEVTIRFDEWHTHIGPFLGLSAEETVFTALRMIEGFLAEDTVVTVARRDGTIIEAGLEYVAAPSEAKPRATTTVLSWKNTYNKVIVRDDDPGRRSGQ